MKSQSFKVDITELTLFVVHLQEDWKVWGTCLSPQSGVSDCLSACQRKPALLTGSCLLPFPAHMQSLDRARSGFLIMQTAVLAIPHQLTLLSHIPGEDS